MSQVNCTLLPTSPQINHKPMSHLSQIHCLPLISYHILLFMKTSCLVNVYVCVCLICKAFHHTAQNVPESGDKAVGNFSVEVRRECACPCQSLHKELLPVFVFIFNCCNEHVTWLFQFNFHLIKIHENNTNPPDQVFTMSINTQLKPYISGL